MTVASLDASVATLPPLPSLAISDGQRVLLRNAEVRHTNLQAGWRV